jgi:hypothetical protein
MKFRTIVAPLLAITTLSILVFSQTSRATELKVDIDGIWGISEQGTAEQGANCDRWASGWGGSPDAISDTDPGIQNSSKNDTNQYRYGAQDVNYEPPPCLNFSDQSGFTFDGVKDISLPTDGSAFVLGEFTHYNTTTNGVDSPESIGLTFVFSGGAEASFQYDVTLVETINDEVPCMYPDAPNVPPCGEKVAISSQPMQNSSIAIAGSQYTLEMLGFTDCGEESTPNTILYTREMAIDSACVYARLKETP